MLRKTFWCLGPLSTLSRYILLPEGTEWDSCLLWPLKEGWEEEVCVFGVCFEWGEKKAVEGELSPDMEAVAQKKKLWEGGMGGVRGHIQGALTEALPTHSLSSKTLTRTFEGGQRYCVAWHPEWQRDLFWLVRVTAAIINSDLPSLFISRTFGWIITFGCRNPRLNKVNISVCKNNLSSLCQDLKSLVINIHIKKAFH